MIMGGPRDVDDIKRQLQGQIHGLLNTLYPNVSARQMRGTYLQLGDVAGGDGQSCIVNLKHSKGFAPGSFHDYSTGEAGDVLALIAKARGTDFKGAMEFARSFLGIDPVRPLSAAEREALARERRRREEEDRKKREAAEMAAQQRVKAAHHIFLSARADLIDTPVDHYLLGRRIDLRELPSTGACRYQPECLDAATGELLPAMVLCVTGPDGKFAAVQRTYLECVDGIWRRIKRPDKHGRMRSLKLALGDVRGGHVSVSKGRADCPLGRAPQGDAVLIAEGYETACTYAVAAPDLRVIATLSIDNMAQVAIPKTVTTRFIVREGGMKPATQVQFDKVIAAHQAQCDDVRIINTEPGYSDDNDFLMDEDVA